MQRRKVLPVNVANLLSVIAQGISNYPDQLIRGPRSSVVFGLIMSLQTTLVTFNPELFLDDAPVEFLQKIPSYQDLQRISPWAVETRIFRKSGNILLFCKCVMIHH